MNKFKQPLDLREVVNLLTADLVWSDDFESIRTPLAGLLTSLSNLPSDSKSAISDDLQNFLDAVLDQPIITITGK
jgi:hypothetical protein